MNLLETQGLSILVVEPPLEKLVKPTQTPSLNQFGHFGAAGVLRSQARCLRIGFSFAFLSVDALLSLGH